MISCYAANVRMENEKQITATSVTLASWRLNSSAIRLTQGLYSLSGKTSYRKISWSLEAARFGFKLFQSLWNLAGTSAALLPRCLSNFRAIRPLQHPISWPRDFTRFGGKTSYRLVNRGPVSVNLPCRIVQRTPTQSKVQVVYMIFLLYFEIDHCDVYI